MNSEKNITYNLKKDIKIEDKYIEKDIKVDEHVIFYLLNASNKEYTIKYVNKYGIMNIITVNEAYFREHFKRVNPHGREVICPKTYKHFKHEIERDKPLNKVIPNNFIYCTMFIAQAISVDNKIIGKTNKHITIYHTEKDREITIYLINGKWYYITDNLLDEDLVIYRSLYDDKIPYGRPVTMFLSKVDKIKYSHIEQEYRFEEYIIEGDK